MKKCVLFFAAFAFLCTGVISPSFAEDAKKDKGPEKITIKPTAKKPKKAPVEFPHREHQKRLECGECHHSKGEDGKQVAYKEGQKNQKCSTCHNEKELKGRTLDLGGKKPLKLDTLKGAGHGNCRACHRAEAKKDPKKKHLKKCKTCHPKKKKK